MNLDDVAERFALDDMFSYYPVGATIDDLSDVANACSDYFSHDEWMLCQDFEDYAYISANAIVGLALDKADSFKYYYQLVTK